MCPDSIPDNLITGGFGQDAFSGVDDCMFCGWLRDIQRVRTNWGKQDKFTVTLHLYCAAGGQACCSFPNTPTLPRLEATRGSCDPVVLSPSRLVFCDAPFIILK